MTIIPIESVRSFSHSRCAADESCRYKRYLSREWGGTGIIPTVDGWDKLFGNLLHKGLENFAVSGDFKLPELKDKCVSEAMAAGKDIHGARDWTALLAGLLLGFQRVVWPQLMAEYEIIGTERWIEWMAKPGFKFRARQDLLLKNKFDGHICYVDYKSTSSTKPQWIKSWSKSTQLHTSMYALKQSEGIDVERALVIGFNKGWKDEKKHIQRSPLNYGYVNREYSMTPQYSSEYQRSKGWEPFPVWAEFDNVEDWLRKVPTETLIEQFPQTGPIFARDDIAIKWFRQQLIREEEVDEGLKLLEISTSIEEIQPILDKYFRQNFSHCEPAFGYDCEYKNHCWIPSIEADPLGSGQFKRYDPEAEIE